MVDSKLKEMVTGIGQQYWRVTKQGQVTEVREILTRPKSKPPKKREKIKEFTRAARRRMVTFLARIKWAEVKRAVMVTLTYPDAYQGITYKARTAQRKGFVRRMELRADIEVPTIWRVEWPERKSGELIGQQMPHLHMVMLGLPFIPWVEIKAAWAASINWDGPLCTYIQECTDSVRTAKYLTKYLAKPALSSSLDNLSYLYLDGRQWGVTRKARIPMEDIRSVVIKSKEAVDRQKKLLANCVPSDLLATMNSFTIIGDEAERAFEIFEQVAIANGTEFA